MPTEEQIKKKLTECYKDRKPVLLFNDNNENIFDRLDLVKKVHRENAGKRNRNLLKIVEFVGAEPNSEIFIKEIGEQYDKALYDEQNKRTTLLTGASMVGSSSLRRKPKKPQSIVKIENKVREYFKSTVKTFYFAYCGPYTGEGLYNFLVQKEDLVSIPIPSNPPNSVKIWESLLFEYRGTVYLDDLRCKPRGKKDYVYYNRLGNIIEEGKLVYPITKKQFDVGFNWLVIYADVDDPNIFPKEFRNRFEPISLSDKSGKVVATVKERIKAEDRRQEGKIVQFQTLPGTKWTDVEITFIDNDYVRIKVGDEVKNRVHYSEMGFKDERSGQPIQLWKDTLRKFALANGTIPPKHDKRGKLIEIVSIDDVKRLRKKLQSYFGISGNPISYIKGKYIKGKYIEAEGYKTLFRIKDESHIQDTVFNNQE